MRSSAHALFIAAVLTVLALPRIDAAPAASKQSPERMARESPFRDLEWRAVGPKFHGGRLQAIARQGLSIDQVYEGFKNPPAEARPFVRWWWNNNQVEEEEILRELDVLKAAGVGGIEINPIAGWEGPTGSKATVLTWRSEEWHRMLHVACKGAKERGLIVDLIAGSGWPFGGEFLKPDE